MYDRHHFVMRTNKQSISSGVIEILATSVEKYLQLEDFLYNTSLYAYYGGRTVPKKSALAMALRRLKTRGLIEESKIDNQIVYKLTSSGQELISKSEKLLPNNQSILVVFDIPEQKRFIRNLFRRNLKKWGFVQFQKSVWLSQNDVYQKLEAYINDLKIQQWVSVFQTSRFTSNKT